MTKDELEKKRDELADKRHKIFPNDTPRIKEKLTEWKNEFLDGFDSCAALLQVEMDAKNLEITKLAEEYQELEDQIISWENYSIDQANEIKELQKLFYKIESLTTQLQSANAKLAVARAAIKDFLDCSGNIEQNDERLGWLKEALAAMDASEGKVENE